jgi:hypothetical protein
LHAIKIKRIGDIKSRFFMLLDFAHNAYIKPVCRCKL